MNLIELLASRQFHEACYGLLGFAFAATILATGCLLVFYATAYLVRSLIRTWVKR